MTELRPRIAKAAADLGRPLGADALEMVARWVDLVRTWNAKIDLTAARTDDELVDLMVADALVLAPRLADGATVVDVGSGAGAPGLPIALLRPDAAVTLVEPLQKRVSFLRTAIGALRPGADSPRVVRDKGEPIAARGAAFDVAISRATLAPGAWLALGARLAPAGRVWVLLAREAPPVLAGWAVEEDVRYVWPLTAAERRAVCFARG